MLRVKQLLTRTPNIVHKRSKRCASRVDSAELYMDDAGVFRFLQGTVVDPPPPGPWRNSRGPYRCLCKLYFDEKGVTNNPKVFIWCDCEYFKFNCETTLALLGSSAIINSNGALPKITNPTGRPQVCKHCLAFLRKSLDRKRFSALRPEKNPQSFNLLQALDKLDSTNHVSRRNLRSKFPKMFKQNKPHKVTEQNVVLRKR
jgi:hypothetical protein